MPLAACVQLNGSSDVERTLRVTERLVRQAAAAGASQAGGAWPRGRAHEQEEPAPEGRRQGRGPESLLLLLR